MWRFPRDLTATPHHLLRSQDCPTLYSTPHTPHYKPRSDALVDAQITEQAVQLPFHTSHVEITLCIRPGECSQIAFPESPTTNSAKSSWIP